MVLTIWKTLPEFPFYQVSNTGKVKMLNKGVWENRPAHNSNGYLVVRIKNRRGEWHNVAVHRLVAMAFVPKPPSDEKLEVNHIDENKANNRADNLEWVTRSQNIQYSYDRKSTSEKRGVKVVQLSPDGEFIKRWNSYTEIAIALEIPISRIRENCGKWGRNRQRMINGYRWVLEKEWLANNGINDL